MKIKTTYLLCIISIFEIIFMKSMESIILWSLYAIYRFFNDPE